MASVSCLYMSLLGRFASSLLSGSVFAASSSNWGFSCKRNRFEAKFSLKEIKICNQRIQYATELERKLKGREHEESKTHAKKCAKDADVLITMNYIRLYHITITINCDLVGRLDKSRAWKGVWISRCSTSLGRSVDFPLPWDSKSADLVAYRIHPWISRSHAFHHGSEIVHVDLDAGLEKLPKPLSNSHLRELHTPFSTSNLWRHCSPWHVAGANSGCSHPYHDFHSPHATDHILPWSNWQNSRPKDIGHDPIRSWPEAFSHIDSHDFVPSNVPLEVSLLSLLCLQFSHTPSQSHGLDFVGTGPFTRRKIRSKQIRTDKCDKYSQVGNFRRLCVALQFVDRFFTLWTTPLSSNI